MSQANPNIDLTYLNDFFAREGKKMLDKTEFYKAKLYRITHQMMKVDSISAYLAQASIEMYFGNTDDGIQLTEKALHLTNGASLMGWSVLINGHAQAGNYIKTIESYKIYRELFEHEELELKSIYVHVIRMFLLEDLFNEIATHEGDKILLNKHLNQIEHLKKLNISLDIYRKFVSNIYSIFHKYFKGRIEPVISLGDSNLAIRANVEVDNAKDLFELNNNFNDYIFDWYAASEQDVRDQIEKITVYFQQKDFREEEIKVPA
ncbi:hypothetical protein [Acinetobacter seifertii]|uniref:hypothetical protein n=1 Tax=Acinetobacter seifertii TaxID=1530123 RepID=UPI003213A65A